MKHVFIMLATALFLSVASAVTLPDDARITAVSSSGVVVGVGELVDGNLDLSLAVGTDGFVTLIIESEGVTLTLEGLVNASGEVLVISDGDFVDLVADVEGAGGQALVAFEERVAQGVEDVESLPEEAQDGMEAAAANFDGAMENAAAGRANAGGDAEVEADGSAQTGVDASTAGGAKADAAADVAVEADSDVNVDLSVGEDAAERGAGNRR